MKTSYLGVILFITTVGCYYSYIIKPISSSSSRSAQTIPYFSATMNLKMVDGKVTTSDVYSLNSIRSTLIRQEETIIFALIERAQFRQNTLIYDPLKSPLKDPNGESISLLSWMFIQTEAVHAQVRRYTSPEEHAFFPQFIPEPVLPTLQFPELLVSTKDAVDVNHDIMNQYINKIIPEICNSGDDEQHGSSITCDVTAMQALSKRIHYGKFVAESKFLDDPNTYTTLVKNGDVAGVLNLLTNTEVEKNVLKRAYLKASTYGQDLAGNRGGDRLIDPALIANIYRDMIIPLTKDVEIRYLWKRAGLESTPDASAYFHLCNAPTINYKE